MKISFLTLLFFAVANLCLAQQSKFAIVDKDNNPANYGVNALKSKISLTISVDASTTSIYPFNNIPNDSLGNIVFLENAQKALLTVRLRKDSLQYYRYTIIENDTKVIVKDAIPNKEATSPVI
jgi:two-component system LytT family sensor kinase